MKGCIKLFEEKNGPCDKHSGGLIYRIVQGKITASQQNKKVELLQPQLWVKSLLQEILQGDK